MRVVERNREDWLPAFRDLSRPLDRGVVTSVIRIESAITLVAGSEVHCVVVALVNVAV